MWGWSCILLCTQNNIIDLQCRCLALVFVSRLHFTIDASSFKQRSRALHANHVTIFCRWVVSPAHVIGASALDE